VFGDKNETSWINTKDEKKVIQVPKTLTNQFYLTNPNGVFAVF